MRLGYTSPDGEMGFPGTVTAEVKYTLTARGELLQEFTATTDRPTPFNMAQHSYFNLGGHGSGSVLLHELDMPSATHVLPVDAAYAH